MTVLVTGGAGYIGSHTVRLLAGLGRRVVVLDSLELGRRSRVLDVPLVVGDVADTALVERTIREHEVDAVIHFAAYKAAGESMEVPEKYFRNIVGGSLSVLEAMLATGVQRFVLSSTAALYGTPDQLPVAEDAPLHPENPYGEAKRMVEQMLHWFDACHGLRYVSLRYFNAAGASADAVIGEDWSQSRNLVPQVMRAALERGPKLKLFGTDYPTPDGTAIRDYIHVDDLADAHIKALERLERGEPGHRRGELGAAGGRRRRAHRRCAGAARRGAEAARGPGRALRRQPPGPRRARLGARVPVGADRRERVALALHAPRRHPRVRVRPPAR
jgi:UDP-glucose-4-epimerase GalE